MRFKIEQYSPEFDSSSSLGYMDGSGKVSLLVREGDCHCGCEQPARKGRQFLQGHDQRLKGILIRAHLAGVEVFQSDGTNASQTSALDAATKRGWDTYLLDAGDRYARQPISEGKPASKVKDELVGTTRTVKVGRWEYDGTVTKTNGSTVTVEVQMKNGDTKTVEVAR